MITLWKERLLSQGAMLFACLAFFAIVPTVAVSACPIEPKMVRIPAGTFSMGSPKDEAGRFDDETLYRVSVGGFSIGQYDVTFAEYDCFLNDVDGRVPSDAGWGRGNRPVINVSWQEATAYAQWLSKKTGEQYRLPTEAEWEYAARAGTTTAYYWGNQASHEYANYGKDDCCGGLAEGKDKWVYTSPVGSFAPNPWGLYDMLGNVWQWTCSAYNKSYGSGDEKVCASDDSDVGRVSRGGGWYCVPRGVRAALRADYAPTGRYNGVLGFRLARTN